MPEDISPEIWMHGVKAESASLRKDWPEVRRLCEIVLASRPIAPEFEANTRRLYARALSQLGVGIIKTEEGKRLVADAAEEARKSVALYAGLHVSDDTAAKAHAQLGTALCLLSTTLPHGGARTQKNEDGVAALEKASRLDPENEDAREYLPRAKGMASQNLAAKKSSGCFVATAACGDPSAREVIVLSAFRDDVLLRSRVGRTFVRFYYVVSPPIAAVVARSALLRRSAMLLVIRPAVCLVKRVPK